jgi:hypothetical protein
MQQAPKKATDEYVAMLARKLHESQERVSVAVNLCGRNFKKIKLLLFQHNEDGAIPLIARLLGETKGRVAVAHAACGTDLGKIELFLRQNRGCGDYI